MWSDKFHELFIILPYNKTEIEYKSDHVFDTFPILFKQCSRSILVCHPIRLTPLFFNNVKTEK